MVTRFFKDDTELETYITSAHYGVCSEVRYVVFSILAHKKGNFIPGSLSPLDFFFFVHVFRMSLMFWSLD